MVTTIEDEVLELCTRTVARTPIMRPAIGFCSSWLSENAAPVMSTPTLCTRDNSPVQIQRNKAHEADKILQILLSGSEASCFGPTF